MDTISYAIQQLQVLEIPDLVCVDSTDWEVLKRTTCVMRYDEPVVCVCLLLQDLVQSCLRGEGGILEDMCYERRRAEACVTGTSLPITH